MKPRNLVINGSLRQNGNTDRIVKAYARGARAGGARVKKVILRTLSVSDCRGCYQCRDKGSCSIDDDMTGLRKEIAKAALIVFASPLYFCGVTGLMRVFLDRLYFFYHRENNHHIVGKAAVVLIPFGEKKIGYETHLVNEFFARFLKALNLEMLEIIYFPDLMDKDAFRSHPGSLERAFTLGRDVQGRLKERTLATELGE